MHRDFGYHKAFQKAYNLQNEHDDVFQTTDFKILTQRDEIIQSAVDYFRFPQKDLLMPSKSIAVAIIYATLIEKYFKIPLRSSLNDSDLFCGNDRYFVPYSQDPTLYEEILSQLCTKSSMADLAESFFSNPLGQIEKTLRYFYEEFGLVKPGFHDTINENVES